MQDSARLSVRPRQAYHRSLTATNIRSKERTAKRHPPLARRESDRVILDAEVTMDELLHEIERLPKEWRERGIERLQGDAITCSEPEALWEPGRREPEPVSRSVAGEQARTADEGLAQSRFQSGSSGSPR